MGSENKIYLDILEKLRETEKIKNVKILMAIESGSRSWGFPSPDSDYDCRFIYVHEKDFYVSIFDKKDFIEYEVDEVFDINGWDLKKSLSHIVKSNAVMFEWISSKEFYLANNNVVSILKNLANDFFNPIAISYHYLNLAKGMLNDILKEEKAKLKKYFYVLRPLCNIKYIETFNKMPPMNFFETLSKISIEKEILNEINAISKEKTLVNESHYTKKNYILIKHFEDEFERQEERLKKTTFTKNRDYEKVDNEFRKIIEMVW